MTTPDLDALAALTRDYAAFQARKSGLATALGGLAALLLALAALSPRFMGATFMGRMVVEYLVWVPLVWLGLKGALGRGLYRKLGSVVAAPDVRYERRRWFWILGLALFLIVVLLSAVYAFSQGFFQANPARAALCPPPLWILAMPPLYLLATPWAVRGIEEARVYAVLVGQSILWLIPLFLFSFAPTVPPRSGWGSFGNAAGIGLLVLIGTIQIWGALAMIRGWKEHREYLAILRSLPRVQEG